MARTWLFAYSFSIAFHASVNSPWDGTGQWIR